MRVKLATGGKRYSRAMLATLFRLLTIACLVLMPLAMANTLAAATHEPAAAAMPCEGHDQPTKIRPFGKVHCTGCVAIAVPQPAFPAVAVQPHAILVDREGRLPLGLAPEVATPPPKRV